jgi:hypothetical protein
MAYMTDWGDIWVSKSEGDMFSEAWAAMDSRTDLTDEERTILDWAERIWFVGGNFNPERHGCYQGLLDLCEKKHHVLERLLKPKGGGEMRIVPWRTPVYDDFPGNQWPKEKTKRMERDGLTPKDVRARRRCEVRDAYYKNHLTEAERVNVDQRARIGALEQKVADLEHRMPSRRRMLCTGFWTVWSACRARSTDSPRWSTSSKLCLRVRCGSPRTKSTLMSSRCTEMKDAGSGQMPYVTTEPEDGWVANEQSASSRAELRLYTRTAAEVGTTAAFQGN